MVNVYKSGDTIPLYGGRINGGLTIVLNIWEEMDGLRELCAQTEGRFDLYNKIGSSTFDLFHWHLIRRSPMSAVREEVPSLPENPEDFKAAMDFALFTIRDIWRNEGDNGKSLRAAISLADPARGIEELEYQGEAPGLLLYSGSIKVRTVLRPWKAKVNWGVILFTIAPSQRAERTVEAMRERAAMWSIYPKLDRIDKMKNMELQNRTAVIIFLHGLLSTDLVVFDQLITRLKLHSDFLNRNWAFVGWPHDTLTSIRNNAADLQREIERVIGPDGPPIAFVCHSRGGLVARSVAAALCTKSANKELNDEWVAKLRGCITFGTPHEGAVMAEIWPGFLGLFLLAQGYKHGNGLASLADALLYCQSSGTFDGIKDLRPARAGRETFLMRLREEEGKIAPRGKERALPIFAIGGQDPKPPNMINLLLGNAEHDGVVSLESTASRYTDRVKHTTCNHFGYFEDALLDELESDITQFLDKIL